MKTDKRARIVCATVMILLFLGSAASAAQHERPMTSNGTSKADILYVGGEGPGNYTKIQDAVVNASDGDTVFVYHGTYLEHPRVEKSIALLGENKSTTVIDGQELGYVVRILTGNVTFSGFTVQNCGLTSNEAEIYVDADHVTITGTVLTHDTPLGENGIRLWNSTGNVIAGNTIMNHYYGIWLEYSPGNTLSDNSIMASREWGIILGNSAGNDISGNVITQNAGGIYLRDSCNNTIAGNNITGNTRGVALVEVDAATEQNTITQNSFTRNSRADATFLLREGSRSKNIWDENYWNRPLRHPKLILGLKTIYTFPGVPFHLPPMPLTIPWLAVDLHPA